MKNYEVGIIVGVIALVGFFWYKNSSGTPVQQPIGGTAKIINISSPSGCCVAVGGARMQSTTMISAPTCLEQP